MISVAYFPTFKRKFYFSNSLNGKLLLKQFYQPYGILTGLFCIFWDKLPFLTKLFTTTANKLPLHINTLHTILGWNNIDFVLSGGAGIEKKITGLCINKETGEKVFFKYGSSDCAVQLIKNEIKILNSTSLPIIPKLLYNGVEINKNIWFVTETFEGIKYTKTKVTQAILNLLIQINKADNFKNEKDNNQLILVFSHGDFCPWNLVLDTTNAIKVIDWEMAGEYPLGYDLFTFIFQSSFLLTPKKTSSALINENINWINQYFSHFGVQDYTPYLKEFTHIKLAKEKLKKSLDLIEGYQNLKTTVGIL